ncbi:hypothetical protein HZF08_05310 [Paenibacillus sp. CGMCC 1.16610]|uniref:Uncharacterized protein n=1 Tax=Paenibacillus anseongense TaxID=2682845 RepID=A0ABW9UBJ9_9BACL|nr:MULTISPECIES: hypothetical protein [Paenibacillus]MBA2937714.1 hypothetical protein [Paenibacillus sp. CGMCC 1.16610]MVQ36772.1 hypothetical protein [Paenibacillus anseongense]
MIMSIIYYLTFMVVWSFVTIRSMLRRQKKREAAVFGGIMTVSSIIGTLLIARVNLPSMIVPFKIVFEPFGKMLLMR